MPLDALVDPSPVNATAAQSLSVTVRMPDGGVLSPPVRDGDRIIDALAAFGLPMRHAPDNTPCRSRIDPTWAARLQPADRIEHAAFGADDGTTRLLDHLVMTPELNGLEIELPWDALVPQTYWIAG
jgi:hypothetical protein